MSAIDLDILPQKSLTEFKKAILDANCTESDLEKIACRMIMTYKSDYLKILINNFGFKFDNEFMERNAVNLNHVKLNQMRINILCDDIIGKNLVDEFRSELHEVNYNQSELESIATKIIIQHKPILMKILLTEFNFKLTNDFIKNYAETMDHNMFETIIDISGDSFLEELNYEALSAIFMQELMNYHPNSIIYKLINFGFDANKVSPRNKSDIIRYSTYHRDAHNILKLILDNGFNLDFVNQNILIYLIIHNRLDIITMMINYGLDVNILNQITIPKYFHDNYIQLIDLGIDPEKIAYTLSGKDKDNDDGDIDNDDE